MSLYTVHIYREMRLRFDEIEADTPEAAADMASKRFLNDADHFDDCDGHTFAALVDEEYDHDYEHSKIIDFAAGRLFDTAPKLLAALTWLIDDLTDAAEDRNPETGEAYDSVAYAREQIAAAKQTGIPSVSTTTPKMLAALLLAQRALNTAPRFRVGDTDSYQIAAQVDDAIRAATAKTKAA
jgi:hypothetical protein